MSQERHPRLNPLYAVIKYRDFRFLWGAGVIMQISQWVQNITLGWLALELTNSAAFVGQVNFMSGLPILLLSLPAGVMLDRFDRRRILLVCQIAGTVVAAAVALYSGSSTLLPWHLLVVAVLNGALLAVSVPATQTIVPSLVERGDLTNALGLTAAGGSLTRILGPSLGGVVIGVFGAVGCFAAQAVGMAGSAVLTLLVRARDTFKQQPTENATHPLRVLNEVRHEPVVVGLLLQAVAPGLLAYPVLVMIPVLARDQLGLGPFGLGVLMSASGVGAVIGSIIVAMLGSYPHKGRLLFVVGAVYGFVLAAFAQSSVPWLSGIIFACSSFFGVFHNALTTALLQEQTAEHLRGQVTAALALAFGLSPIGALGIGELAEHIGISNAISCGGIAASICIILVMLRYRQLPRI